MAGDCPHSTFLETTLKQCHEGSLLMSSTHESYVRLIEDLKNELEQISCEVITVQKECSSQHQDPATDASVLETSIRELETQNDRLEQALKLQTQTTEAALMELHTNNEFLKCQIAQLECKVIEKDRYIELLRKRVSPPHSIEPQQNALEYIAGGNNFTVELERRIKTLSERLEKSREHEQFLTNEARKLNEELNESKKKNRELIAQAHRVSTLWKCQDTNRMELIKKYEDLEKNYKDQAKELRAAKNQLLMLDEQFHAMEKRQIDNNTERNFLCEEVMSLKEKLASAIGNLKSIQKQLVNTEEQLCTAHEVIKEQKNIMQRIESVHRDSQRRLQDTNAECKRKLSDLLKDHQQLQQELEKQQEINSQQLILLNSFRKWKDEQLRAEEVTRKMLRLHEDHIKDALEDKKKLLVNFHDLSRDYSLLQSEFERLTMLPNSSSSFKNSFNPSTSVAQQLESIRHTMLRLSKQNLTLSKPEEDEDPL